MTTERRAARALPLEQRPQIGNEPIVPGDEFVKLTAGGDVLVLEELRFARLRTSEYRFHHFIVNRGEFGAMTGKEARDHGEPMRDRRGCRRLDIDRTALAGQTIEAER
jgi:hypothetical protein